MSDKSASEDDQTRFRGACQRLPPQTAPKLAHCVPFKAQIEGLLAKQASYDDIRLLLEDVNVVVSKNTVYRFCRQVDRPKICPAIWQGWHKGNFTAQNLAGIAIA